MTETASPPTGTEEVELGMTVDGLASRAAVDPGSRLVDALRDRFGALAPKVGCGTGDCGACTVLRDDEPIKSCLELALNNEGARITTIAGLATEDGELHPVQRAFWDAFGFQCGFCLSGMVLVAHDLVTRTAEPSEEDIREAIAGNLCRCTGYDDIVAAVRLAAARMRGDDQDGS